MTWPGMSLPMTSTTGPDGTILALVNDTEQDTVMDVVVELDPETGAVTELVDFSTLMDGYYGTMTHPVPLTGSSFWQAGEDDWSPPQLCCGRRRQHPGQLPGDLQTQVSGVHSTNPHRPDRRSRLLGGDGV